MTTENVISLYASIAPVAAIFGVAAFAATFAWNNAIANIRTHIYESPGYAAIAKGLQSIDSKADAMRPLRVLMGLTQAIRFTSPAVTLYAAAVPRSHLWTSLVGLAGMAIWAGLLVAWLWSIRQHQKYEVEITTKKMHVNRDATKIDSGLGTT